MAIFNNPYPILSNSSGNFKVCDAEFNCTLTNVEFRDNNYVIEIKSEIVNEPVLQNLLETGEVCFCVSVDSKPFFRRVYKSKKELDTIEIEINYKEMSAECSFDIYPKLIASKDFIYRNKNADYPMDEYYFHLSSKQKVAEHKKISVNFDRAYKLFDSGPLIQLSKLPNGQNPINGFMNIKVDHGLNIIVQLNERNFNLVKEMNRVNPRTLSTTLSFPVIYHALSSIKENPDDFQTIEWAEKLDGIFNFKENLQSMDDVLRMTDIILESPYIKLFEYNIKNES